MSETVDDISKAVKDKVGNDTIFLSQDGSPEDVDTFISTGSTLLDYRIANRRDGGVPVGKITSISGMPQTGKTLLGIQLCANAQKAGGLAVYIDSENAMNFDFAQRVGLDTKNNFMYINPPSLEGVFTIMNKVFDVLHEKEKSKKEQYPFVVIIWDSVASSVPQQELSREEPGTGQIGIKASILSTQVPQLISQIGRRRVAQVFLNQLRNNIVTMGFGEKYTEPGGNAIPFYASARIRLKHAAKLRAKDEVVGVQIKAEVPKTRFGPSFGDCVFNVYYTKGVDDKESILQHLAKHKKVDTRNGGRKGKLYKIGDEEFSIPEYKKKMMTDPEFDKKIKDMLEEVMVKDLIDPDEELLTVDDD